jgi:hypothetical protein
MSGGVAKNPVDPGIEPALRLSLLHIVANIFFATPPTERGIKSTEGQLYFEESILIRQETKT